MSALANVLRTRLIPWAQHDASTRFIVAHAKMRASDMPSGVQLIRRNKTGQRVVVKSNRSYSNIRNIIAEWPEDGLHELHKYALVCILNGHVDYQLGNYKIRCGPGHFIFIPPGTPYPDGSRPYVDLQKGSSCDIVTFLLHPNAIECWMSHGHAQGRERSNGGLVLHDHAISLFQVLMHEVVENAEVPHRIGEIVLLAFFSVFQREVDAGQLQSVRLGSPGHQNEAAMADATHADFATRLKHYIEANLGKSLTLERVSRDMYLSPTQFARNVRRDTGETFNRYVARHRLEEAQALLRDSQWSISAIAGRVGFRSSAYFCTFFKQHVGETPGEYRARALESSYPVKNDEIL